MISKEQYEKAIKQIEEAEKVTAEYHRQRQELFNERMARNPVFTDDELVYAAFSRCPCGAGLAHPKDCGPTHYWDCSAILKGNADKDITHSGTYPFVFYSIKSETSQRAYGQTTREK